MGSAEGPCGKQHKAVFDFQQKGKKGNVPFRFRIWPRREFVEAGADGLQLSGGYAVA
jgi:hypothetical protein